MIIKEIPLDAFDRLFPSGHTVFDGASFNLLNCEKAERVSAYVGFSGDKPLIGQIFGRRDGLWRAPFSAPYSVPSDNFPDTRQTLINDFYQNLRNHLDAPLRLVWTPPFYGDGCPPEADEVIEEANFHYDMADFPTYYEHLNRAARKNHNRALIIPFDFCKTDDIARAYRIIEINRRAMGYPLAMSLDDVKRTVTGVVNAHFFLLSLDGEDVAASMIYEVKEGIMEVVYWGDLPEAREHRTMNRLAWQIFGWVAANRPDIRYIDIGPSSLMGVRNEGLCRFKSSLGCRETPRPILILR